MAHQDVTSREYKVMLLPERSAGAEDTARQAVDQFWNEVSAALAPLDIPTGGRFDEVKAHDDDETTPPVAVEFSFKYGNDRLERAVVAAAQRRGEGAVGVLVVVEP